MRALTLAVGGFAAILAAGTFAIGLETLFRPSEALYGEGIVFGQAAALARGEPLYPPFGEPPYSVTAYTPIFYLLNALLIRLGGPTLVAGRVVALLALGALLILLGRAGGRSGWLVAAVVAASQPVAFWIGLNRVDTLALAFSFGAVVVAPVRLWLALLLVVAAAMTKQTFVFSAIAILGWLLLERRWRDAAWFSASGAVAALALVGTLEWLSGGAFSHHTLDANVNPFSLYMVYDWFQTSQPSTGPLLLVATFAVFALPRLYALWRIYFVVSLVHLILMGKDGAHLNYYLEPLAASGALIALLINRWPEPARLGLAGVLLICQLPQWLPILVETRDALQQRAADSEAVGWATTQVRDAPGDVLTIDLALNGMADRPIAFEYIIFTILSGEGVWDDGRFASDVATGRYVGLMLLGEGNPLAGDCGCFPPEVWRTMQARYDRVDSRGRYVWYRFRPVAFAESSPVGGYTREP